MVGAVAIAVAVAVVVVVESVLWTGIAYVSGSILIAVELFMTGGGRARIDMSRYESVPVVAAC